MNGEREKIRCRRISAASQAQLFSQLSAVPEVAVPDPASSSSCELQQTDAHRDSCCRSCPRGKALLKAVLCSSAASRTVAISTTKSNFSFPLVSGI